MERDEVFVPKTRTQVGLKPESETVQPEQQQAAAHGGKDESMLEKIDDLLEDAPLYNLLCVVAQQTLGWPMYLIRNASGQKYGRHTDRKSKRACCRLCTVLMTFPPCRLQP